MIAAEVAMSSAAPTPCKARDAISQAPFTLTAQSSDPVANTTMPRR